MAGLAEESDEGAQLCALSDGAVWGGSLRLGGDFQPEAQEQTQERSELTRILHV